MQQNSVNSVDAYVQAKVSSTLNMEPKKSDEPGASVFGVPWGTGGGVKAVEALPTSGLFTLCDVMQSVTEQPSTSGTRQSALNNSEEIIGDLESVPGQSSLRAAAFANDKVIASTSQSSGALTYNPNDFRPYTSRR